ncbi:MAG: hypothetical protein NTW29_07450 [Bacteroidetes bacterium]|nr:hypothetical protein [Bacteroidota bacterium]
MKAGFIAIILFYSTRLFAQGDNEFAATAFYNQFKKIYADAQKGFMLNKGAKTLSDFPELTDVYKAKLNLPQADSGRVVFPKNNNLPYALYYFEPAKSRLKSDQRALGLREAIGTAYGKILFTKTETRVVGNDVYTDTWFFEKETDTDKKTALFRISEFPQGNKYYFTLEIRGKTPGATAPAP